MKLAPQGGLDDAPADSIIELTRALVRIPTRAGVDPYEPVFALLEDWLRAHGVGVERLAGPGGATVALVGGEAAFGRRLPLGVVGPSNAGNVLAEAGIEATAGFGVSYRGLHAVDEAIDLTTVAPVYRAYLAAVERLAR